jgi:hypothetical protein
VPTRSARGLLNYLRPLVWSILAIFKVRLPDKFIATMRASRSLLSRPFLRSVVALLSLISKIEHDSRQIVPPLSPSPSFPPSVSPSPVAFCYLLPFFCGVVSFVFNIIQPVFAKRRYTPQILGENLKRTAHHDSISKTCTVVRTSYRSGNIRNY